MFVKKLHFELKEVVSVAQVLPSVTTEKPAVTAEKKHKNRSKVWDQFGDEFLDSVTKKGKVSCIHCASAISTWSTNLAQHLETCKAYKLKQVGKFQNQTKLSWSSDKLTIVNSKYDPAESC
jgi:acetylornithine/succinyldiaminopimelate/putrescine aminotransferase